MRPPKLRDYQPDMIPESPQAVWPLKLMQYPTINSCHKKKEPEPIKPYTILLINLQKETDGGPLWYTEDCFRTDLGYKLPVWRKQATIKQI